MSHAKYDPFNARRSLKVGDTTATIYALPALEQAGLMTLSKLPYSIRVLLENVLRNMDGEIVTADDVETVAGWSPARRSDRELPYMPSRVILQDFTGVPVVADLAAMRSAVAKAGGPAERINPITPVDLVIDHSVQVDTFGTHYAMEENVALEYQRNKERYAFLKWAQGSFSNLRVVPPGTGIIHQVNLEYLASVVQERLVDGEVRWFPDTVVGTDSHTTMINGLGVLGWGVGGIEAEAVMLGQPYYMLLPEVIGVRLVGNLPQGVTATDLVLRVTQMLREHGVVEKFVEFFGPGLAGLSLADRATVANMSPEYGATMGFFPVDTETLAYLRLTGRSEADIRRVEAYCKEQGLFRNDTDPEPEYSHVLTLDLSTIEPSLAGPRRPQDRVELSRMKQNFRQQLVDFYGKDPDTIHSPGVSHGAVAIASITSCTNTSNPSVLLGAGLLAKKAVERGLQVQPYVKTSLAPGSRVVTAYLRAAGLMPYLEALRFHVVGYGCATCIGNSGTLPPDVAQKAQEEDLVLAAVVSGNRNFEGRVNPLVKANYLASPMLVVAYALAGTVSIDLTREPLGFDPNGKPVYLADIWPDSTEIAALSAAVLNSELFRKDYAHVFQGDRVWRDLQAPSGSIYAWDADSTYLQEPPYFEDMPLEVPELNDIKDAQVLVFVEDSVTTDHISPAGAIAADSPAARYLQEHGVAKADFNSYGSRRGNHQVMMRGTFANIRLRNSLASREGGWTTHIPSGEELSIYDAAVRYAAEKTPLLILAGKEYGSGSSRDWAAKGPYLLGVKAVLAESYERIHRSNLIGMGVLPLQFLPGESAKSLGLTGRELYDITGISAELTPKQQVRVTAKQADGSVLEFAAVMRLDSKVEINYYRNGGILQTVLRSLMHAE
ncbi:MAG TPA: aconitate hydratase AcnA [Firmicutes bacterium]|jgi:aconitate hydratase|nr:aconitate hydratase AcnA [Bacillota bacterium]